MFFIIICNEAGDRIDDDSDYPLTEVQLNALLENYDQFEIPGTFGQKFYRNGDQIISYLNLPAE